MKIDNKVAGGSSKSGHIYHTKIACGEFTFSADQSNVTLEHKLGINPDKVIIVSLEKSNPTSPRFSNGIFENLPSFFYGGGTASYSSGHSHYKGWLNVDTSKSTVNKLIINSIIGCFYGESNYQTLNFGAGTTYHWIALA